MAKFSDLVGKTIKKITVQEDQIDILCDDGGKKYQQYRLFHHQDCCEMVIVDDIVGDLTDLIGWPVLRAEERSSNDLPPGVTDGGESSTWTFYELATNKGSVTIRWHGSSNGYYSESVDFEEIS